MAKTLKSIFFCLTLFSFSYSQFNYTTDSLAVRAILDSCGCQPFQMVFHEVDHKMYPATVENVSHATDGRIRSLYITGLLTGRIDGSSPPCSTGILRREIGNLTELETLDVSFNSLQRFPVDFFTLNNLVALDISKNDLRVLQPEIGNFTKLRGLYSHGNALSTLPESIKLLDSLKELGLKLNVFSAIPPSLCSLSGLWRLDLTSNKLDSISENIGNLSSLTVLETWGNNIQYLSPAIGNLKNLWMLDLGYNQLQSLPNEIGRLKSLGRLHLGHNQLHSLPDSIVLRDSLMLTISDNYICSVSPAIQVWLDQYAGIGWQQGQIGCPNNIVQYFHPHKLQNSNTAYFIYDLLGKKSGISKNGQLPLSLRTGIYISKSTAVYGKAVKQCVVK